MLRTKELICEQTDRRTHHFIEVVCLPERFREKKGKKKPSAARDVVTMNVIPTKGVFHRFRPSDSSLIKHIKDVGCYRVVVSYQSI